MQDNNVPQVAPENGLTVQPEARNINNYNNTGDGTLVANVEGNLIQQINITDEQLSRVLDKYFKGAVPVGVPDTPVNTEQALPQPQTQASVPERPVRNTVSRPASPAPRFVSHAMEWASLSKESYNLFVLENEDYNNGSFCISKSCALRYTEPDDYEAYHLLKMDDIEQIKNMPCIFAKRNSYYGHCDSFQPLVFGRIVDVINQGETIKFVFRGFQANPQQQLNENVTELKIARASLRNEFDEEHWSIKRADLINAIERLGIIIK